MKLLTFLAVLTLEAKVASAASPAFGADIETSCVASARYRDIAAARADGYEQLFDCTKGETGNMGQHHTHPGRAGDGMPTVFDNAGCTPLQT